jgi:hypothetical protein
MRSSLRRCFDEIYGETPASFEAIGSPDEAARRLAAATPRSALGSLFTESVVGAVSVDRVVLRRHRPSVSNSFAPYLRGRFTVEDGRTVLRGAFGLHAFVKLFLGVWFGFASLAAVMAAVGAQQPGGAPLSGIEAWLARAFFAAVPLAFGGIGFLFVRFGKWIARGDAAYIRRHVEAALRGENPRRS